MVPTQGQECLLDPQSTPTETAHKSAEKALWRVRVRAAGTQGGARRAQVKLKSLLPPNTTLNQFAQLEIPRHVESQRATAECRVKTDTAKKWFHLEPKHSRSRICTNSRKVNTVETVMWAGSVRVSCQQGRCSSHHHTAQYGVSVSFLRNDTLRELARVYSEFCSGAACSPQSKCHVFAPLG